MKPETPTTKANLLAQFVESIHAAAQALRAWEAFGADTMAFLRERGLVDVFAAYQQKRMKQRVKTQRR